MSKEECTEIDLKRLNNANIPQKYRVIYNTLWNTAMRPGEILKSKPPDYITKLDEINNKTRFFIELHKEKNGTKEGLTAIREYDYITIQDYIKVHKIKNDQYVFGSKKYGRNKKMTVSWLGRKLREHCEMVGITKNLTPQSFRAGLVGYLRDKGLSYEEIAMITRHQNTAIMRKHYDKRRKNRAYDILEEMIP